jgi:DNA-binding transcriptional LysR family regulator
MDSVALDTFLAVARCGSVTGAAEELHTVQSNVTARLKQLESELGVALFARHSRGMNLTAPGTKLVAYAQRLGSLSAEAAMAVRDDGSVRGSLRLGSMETTAALRLPALLGGFHERHPQVQIEVRTGPTSELLEHVLAQRVDGAFVAGPVSHPSLASHVAFREELVLIAARAAEPMADKLRRGALTAIVFRQGCSYRQRLETEFARRGWLPYRRIEFGTVEGILGCVAADVGVTVLPRAVAERFGGDRLRVEPLAPRLAVDTLFVRRADAHEGPTMRHFLEAMTATPGEAFRRGSASAPKGVRAAPRSSSSGRRRGSRTSRP